MHIQWECSMLHVHCSKPANPVHCIPAGRWDWEELAGSQVLPRWQHPAITLWLHRGGSLGGKAKIYVFYGPMLGWEVNFWTYKECTKHIYTYLLRLLASMVKLNTACKKLAASVSSPCFCLTSKKRFQPQDLKAPFSWRNRLLKRACDCWLIRSMPG